MEYQHNDDAERQSQLQLIGCGNWLATGGPEGFNLHRMLGS
jgi:hypothetical protein